jgi:DNA repair exonuclease SbcCD nuclease subunit
VISRLRILHLSDLHIADWYKPWRTLLKVPTADRTVLSHIAKTAYYNKDDVDVIMISGDIADFGYREDLLRAREFLDPMAAFDPIQPWKDRAGHPTLKAVGKPLVLVPGNHDRFDNAAFRPGGALFDQHFSEWTTGLSSVRVHLLPDYATPCMGIVCVDFTLREGKDAKGTFGILGQGKVYPDTLSHLKQETGALRNRYGSIVVIWLLHFAPMFEDKPPAVVAHPRALRLLGGIQVINAAKALNVEYIMCGHLHFGYENRHSSREGTVTVFCAGSAACVGKGNETSMWYYDFEIEAGRVAALEAKKLSYFRDRPGFV